MPYVSVLSSVVGDQYSVNIDLWVNGHVLTVQTSAVDGGSYSVSIDLWWLNGRVHLGLNSSLMDI